MLNCSVTREIGGVNPVNPSTERPSTDLLIIETLFDYLKSCFLEELKTKGNSEEHIDSDIT